MTTEKICVQINRNINHNTVRFRNSVPIVLNLKSDSFPEVPVSPSTTKKLTNPTHTATSVMAMAGNICVKLMAAIAIIPKTVMIPAALFLFFTFVTPVHLSPNVLICVYEKNSQKTMGFRKFKFVIF